MSQAIGKINCPAGTHEDRTPSCAVYEDGSGYCFSCQTYFNQVQSYSLTIQSHGKTIQPDNLEEAFKYIDSLPHVEHRGLSFPYDNAGYYVVWPDKSYYKKRAWPAPDVVKYIGPKGHTAPWFIVVDRPTHQKLIFVEGEINALSLANVLGSDSGYNIISPGSLSGFVDSRLKKSCKLLSRYSKIILMLDSDRGLEPALKCKRLLSELVPDIQIILMDEDWNDLLVKYGKEKAQEKFRTLKV